MRSEKVGKIMKMKRDGQTPSKGIGIYWTTLMILTEATFIYGHGFRSL
jgi:hypothetical protein